MRTLILTILIATFVEFGTAQSLEKETIATAGVYFDNDEIGLNSTIGQTVTGTFESPDGRFSLSQGFHTGTTPQGNGINSEFLTNTGELMLYPNPAQGILFASFIDNRDGKTAYKIFDSKGKLIMDSQSGFNDELIEIDVAGFSPGIYFFTSSFSQGKTLSRSFIKN